MSDQMSSPQEEVAPAPDDAAAQARIAAIILDDSRVDQMRVKRLLGAMELELDCTYVSNVCEFRAALDAQAYDVAFIDYWLTMETGLDAVRAIRAHDTNNQLAVIMLATEAPTEVVVDAVRMGCSTYLTKDKLDVNSLGSAIYNALEDVIQHQLDGEKHSVLRSAMASILDGVASACESELRPAVKEIYRTIGFIRECQAHGLKPDPASFERIDDGCLQISRFLDELNTYRDTWKPDPTRLH